VTCDLARETFDRASDLIYLATNNGMIVKKKFFCSINDGASPEDDDACRNGKIKGELSRAKVYP
jgi:hypothetical protein